MKTLIVALNSKYIHSSLAPWYLKSACSDECGDIEVIEFTINDNFDHVLSAIFLKKALYVAFPCYIWNISYVLKLAEDLKKISPETTIILGGPEVSFDQKKLMVENSFIDFIIAGEGENAFKMLLKHLIGETSEKSEISGLSYRNFEGIILINKQQLIYDLDTIPSPYTDEMISSLRGRIVYFESSRGCPFACSYCLSSINEGVRYFTLERVKNDLKRLLVAGVKQIKFVDRTFNCNKERVKEIFNFIITDKSETNFHFEAAADLFDNEILNLLSQFPIGKIQLEIGVQTTNSFVLDAISRKTETRKVFENIIELRSLNNIHLHLDLIAGLPYEDYKSFINSFNEVYSLKPHQLQLGFLKMLKGSRMRSEAQIHGYSFRSYPPYEILENKYLPFQEMLDLKGVEELVERYYNSGKFGNILEFIIKKHFLSPFDFYRKFLSFNLNGGYIDRPISSREAYFVLWDFLKEQKTEDEKVLVHLNELIKYDFLISDNSNNLPVGIERIMDLGFKDRCFEFLKNEKNISTYMCEFKDIPAKQIYKVVHFEYFKYDILNKNEVKEKQKVILFNYQKKHKVSGLFESIDITEDFN